MAFLMNSFKYTIFLVNLIFFVLGLILLYNTVGQLHDNLFDLDTALKSPIYFTLVVAIIIVFISFLGCCGTCNENPCMIKAYAILIFVCVLLQVVAVVMVYRVDPEEVSKGIKDNLVHNFKNQSESVQTSIQLVQSKYNCCAVDGWEDYGKSEDVPVSCCGGYTENETPANKVGCEKSALIKIQGCKAKLQQQIGSNYKPIYIIVGCVFGFQLIVILLSCALSKNIREQYNVV